LRPAGDIKDQFSAAGIVGQGRVFAREQDRAGFQSSPNELRLYAHRPRGAWLWSFSEAKLQQLNAAGTYRVYGHALEFERDAATAGVAAARRWRLIQPCLCVQDSPQNPCPCDTGMFWWLLADAVIGEGNAGRKDHRGQELQFFDVLVDSKIMVESVRPVSAGLLKGLGENISAEVVLQAACWPELGGLGIIESRLIPIPPGAKKAIIAFVTLVIEKALEPLIDEILKPIWPPRMAASQVGSRAYRDHVARRSFQSERYCARHQENTDSMRSPAGRAQAAARRSRANTAGKRTPNRSEARAACR
jgi:hypothetical protein